MIPPKWLAVICPTEPVEGVIADDPSISGLWSAIRCSRKRRTQVVADHFGETDISGFGANAEEDADVQGGALNVGDQTSQRRVPGVTGESFQ